MKKSCILHDEKNVRKDLEDGKAGAESTKDNRTAKRKSRKAKKKYLGHGPDNSHCTSYDIHYDLSKKEDS